MSPQPVFPSGFLALERWTVLGLTPVLLLLFLVLLLLQCPGLGARGWPGGGPRGLEAGQLAAQGCTIPRLDRLIPTLLLLPFSSGATGFFFPPNEGEREGYLGGFG